MDDLLCDRQHDILQLLKIPLEALLPLLLDPVNRPCHRSLPLIDPLPINRVRLLLRRILTIREPLLIAIIVALLLGVLFNLLRLGSRLFKHPIPLSLSLRKHLLRSPLRLLQLSRRHILPAGTAITSIANASIRRIITSRCSRCRL